VRDVRDKTGDTPQPPEHTYIIHITYDLCTVQYYQHRHSTSTMSDPQQQITLYFDLASSFSYLCFSTLLTHPLFTQKNVKTTFIPVSIGLIMKKSGNSPPVIPGRKSAKQDYIVRDFARRARVLHVPVLKGLPKGFPAGFDTRPV